GDGTLQGVSQLSSGDGQDFGVAAADLNGDGIPDLIFPSRDLSSQGQVTVLLGAGNGAYGPPHTFPTGSQGTIALVVDDFNQDGTLQAPTSNNASGAADSFAMTKGDFNGDGKVDLAIEHQGGGISVFLSNGDGTFQPEVFSSTDSLFTSYSLAAGDLNGDGKSDIVIVGLDVSTGNSSATVYLSNGDGTLT